MMTSGGGAKYKGSIDCATQIMKNDGLHEHDEGCWCQRSPWCRWCRCARRFRQVPGHVHRVENQPVRSAQHPRQLIHTHVIYNFMPRSILPIRWFGLYKQLLKSIVNVSDCSYVKIKLSRTKKT